MGIGHEQLIVVIESGPEELSMLAEGLQATGANNPIRHLEVGKRLSTIFVIVASGVTRCSQQHLS
jgi:hypothetical protein